MSSNQWVNYGIAIVVGLVTFGVGWYVGFAYAATAGLLATSLTASYLNAKYARPSLGGVKGLGSSAFGRQETGGGKDAAAQSLQINSSSEALAIPVVFGICRISGNFLRYDTSTFRVVPIIERIQRDPSAVAYDKAVAAYRSNPSKVNHALDSKAAKQSGGGGGKGGGGSSSPPPSTSLSGNEKINAYTQILLENDASGRKPLPKEYDEIIVGYKYYLTWELGFCMGPVDALLAMRCFPGEEATINNAANPTVTGNSSVFTGRGAESGGTIRFYRGTANQTRDNADPYKKATTNYRNVCFAVFQNYWMGNSPAPSSYSAEVQRFPVVLDGAGVALTDFPVRGGYAQTAKTFSGPSWAAGVLSVTCTGHGYAVGDKVKIEGTTPAGWSGKQFVVASTPTANTLTLTAPTNYGTITTPGKLRAAPHPCYDDANPAAILYEIFTNKLWGQGLDPDLMDIESFRQAAHYFADNNIGMSFSLELQNVVSDAVEIIKNHVDTVVLWVGDKLRCRVMMDRSRAYDPMVVLTSDNVVKPAITRPAWPSTVNELRVEFTNRQNNFGSEIVLCQDLGNMATVQRINSTKLHLPAFSNRRVVESQGPRILSGMSYPRATLKFTMNRFETRMQPGDFLKYINNEFADGSIVTFWRVIEITDGEKNDEGINVICVEDEFATPTTDPGAPFELPIPAYEGRGLNDDEDVHQGSGLNDDYVPGDMTFAMRELTIFQSDAQRLVALFAQRRNGFTTGVKFLYRVNGSGGDFRDMGVLTPWASLATLKTDIPSTWPLATRIGTYVFDLQLDDETEAADFLEKCSTAPTDADGLDIVTGAQINFLFIGGEIFQIAQAIDQGTPGWVTVTAYLRSLYGTEREAHVIGDRAAYVYEFIPFAHLLHYDDVPINGLLDIRAIPISLNGQEGDPFDFTYTLTNRARKALRVEVVEVASIVGSDWTVIFRPRFHNRGSEFDSDIEVDLEILTGAIPTGYEFYVMPQNVANADLAPAPVKVIPLFTPDDGAGVDASVGTIEFDYTVPATTHHLVLYQVFDGVLGEPATVLP